jgi:hypothetical protein
MYINIHSDLDPKESLPSLVPIHDGENFDDAKEEEEDLSGLVPILPSAGHDTEARSISCRWLYLIYIYIYMYIYKYIYIYTLYICNVCINIFIYVYMYMYNVNNFHQQLK